MNEGACHPVLTDLAAWVGATPRAADQLASGRLASGRLELRDARLTEVRVLLCRAEDLISDVLARHRPESDAPYVASELTVVGQQLAAVPESFDGSRDDPALLQRAAVLCAGHEWARLRGLLPGLQSRISLVVEAIGETAVGLARLRRAGPHLTVAPDAALLELEAAEGVVDEELRRRTALAGAASAYAAADAAVLPSLADFLR